METCTLSDQDDPVSPRPSPGTDPLTALRSAVGFQISWLRDCRLLPTHDDFLESLLRAIDGATRSIQLIYFIIAPSGVGAVLLDHLRRALSRGVSVWVLADEFGSRGLRGSWLHRLHEAGGHVALGNTWNLAMRRRRLNCRNHRKLAIIDGKMAFLGGMNLSNSEHSRRGHVWLDLSLHFRGELVQHCLRCFHDDWSYAKGSEDAEPEEWGGCARQTAAWPGIPRPADARPAALLVGGPCSPNGSVLASLIALLDAAVTTIHLTTPYYSGEPHLVAALARAVERGVRVRLVVSTESDVPGLLQVARSHYPELLDSGVEIAEQQHGFHHEKLLLIDDRWVVLGSVNLDHRSLLHNREIGVAIDDPDLHVQVVAWLGGFEEQCHCVTSSVVPGQVVKTVCRSLAPLF